MRRPPGALTAAAVWPFWGISSRPSARVSSLLPTQFPHTCGRSPRGTEVWGREGLREADAREMNLMVGKNSVFLSQLMDSLSPSSINQSEHVCLSHQWWGRAMLRDQFRSTATVNNWVIDYFPDTSVQSKSFGIRRKSLSPKRTVFVLLS